MVGGGSRLRCLQGETDTNISGVMSIVGSTQCYGVWSMDLALWLPFIILFE